jgi:hypothetical protein
MLPSQAASSGRTAGVPSPLARPDRTLDSHASRLRRKLNAVGDTVYVLNV